EGRGTAPEEDRREAHEALEAAGGLHRRFRERAIQAGPLQVLIPGIFPLVQLPFKAPSGAFPFGAPCSMIAACSKACLYFLFSPPSAFSPNPGWSGTSTVPT